MTPTRYTITLEPVTSGRFRTPPIQRFRALLKAALRGYATPQLTILKE